MSRVKGTCQLCEREDLQVETKRHLCSTCWNWSIRDKKAGVPTFRKKYCSDACAKVGVNISQSLRYNSEKSVKDLEVYQPAKKLLMTDAEQRVIDQAQPRYLDRQLQDPRNRFLVRGAEWLWSAQ